MAYRHLSMATVNLKNIVMCRSPSFSYSKHILEPFLNHKSTKMKNLCMKLILEYNSMEQLLRQAKPVYELNILARPE